MLRHERENLIKQLAIEQKMGRKPQFTSVPKPVLVEPSDNAEEPLPEEKLLPEKLLPVENLPVKKLSPTQITYTRILRFLATQTEPVLSGVVGNAIFPGTGSTRVSSRISELVSIGLVEHAGGRRHLRTYRITEKGKIESKNDSISKSARETILMSKRSLRRTEKEATVNAVNEPDAQKHDPVESPAHYKAAGVECIDVIREMLTPEEFSAFCVATAFAYLWRAKAKGQQKQDIRKAYKYLGWAVGAMGE